jgi:hypothetical protein
MMALSTRYEAIILEHWPVYLVLSVVILAGAYAAAALSVFGERRTGSSHFASGN